MKLTRPAADEYAPYYGTYVDRVGDGDLLADLGSSLRVTLDLLAMVPRERETWSYAPGKWSFRQVAGHLTEVERLFSFRALHIARRDPAPLPGMDQEIWMSASNAADRPLAEIVDEWRDVRAATVSLFAGLPDEAADYRGTASGTPVTVRALGAIVLGHELHHRTGLIEAYGLS